MQQSSRSHTPCTFVKAGWLALVLRCCEYQNQMNANSFHYDHDNYIDHLILVCTVSFTSHLDKGWRTGLIHPADQVPFITTRLNYPVLLIAITTDDGILFERIRNVLCHTIQVVGFWYSSTIIGQAEPNKSYFRLQTLNPISQASTLFEVDGQNPQSQTNILSSYNRPRDLAFKNHHSTENDPHYI